jgi:hypothetical protein
VILTKGCEAPRLAFTSMQSDLSSKSFGAPDGPVQAERAGLRAQRGDQELQDLDLADQALLGLFRKDLQLSAAQQVVPPEGAPDGAFEGLGFGLGKLARRHDVAAERFEQLQLCAVLQPDVEDRASRQGLEPDLEVPELGQIGGQFISAEML